MDSRPVAATLSGLWLLHGRSVGTRGLSPAKPGFTAAPSGERAARFTPPPEDEYGVQKVMDVKLAERGTRVTVTLRVTF